MNHISAKLIRISCRVFDAAVKFAMVIDAAKKTSQPSNNAQPPRSQIEGDTDNDLVIADESGFLIEGKAHANGTVKNTSIVFEGDKGALSNADLVDCDFQGCGDTEFNGKMTGGAFSGGILTSQSTIDGSAVSNSIIKGTIENVSSISNVKFDNATLLPSTTAKVGDFNGTIHYSVNGRKGDVKVKKAEFQFGESGKYLQWWSGDVDEQSDAIPFEGEYSNISAKFDYHGQSVFKTENATFTYKEKKVEWKSGGAPEDKQETKLDTIVFNGRYGTESGFSGRIEASNPNTKGTVSFKDGKAEIKGNQFRQLEANECNWADFSSLTMSNFKIGEMDFTVQNQDTNEYASCERANFYYDGKSSLVTWKKGVFKGGKWTKKGMWFAKDEDWKGGFDADGNWHDDSPMHWGRPTIITTNETSRDSNGKFKQGIDENNQSYDYEERYKLMSQCGMIDKSLTFTNPAQFGEIEGVFVNTFHPGKPIEHQSLDVVYSNGLRVLYQPTENSANGELKIASIEFFDASHLTRIFKNERSFNGFKYDENGNIDTTHIESGGKNEYSASRDLKARAIAVAKSGLYDGISNKEIKWCNDNGATAVKKFKDEYDYWKDRSETELDAEIEKQTKIINKWKSKQDFNSNDQEP